MHTNVKFEGLVPLFHSATFDQLATPIPLWSDPQANTTVHKCTTNANTSCLGKNLVDLVSSYWTADVDAHDTSIKPIANMPIVSGATAFDDLISGDTCIIVFSTLRRRLRSHSDQPQPTACIRHTIVCIHSQSWSTRCRTFRSALLVLKLYFALECLRPAELCTCKHILMTSSHPWNPFAVVMSQATAQGGSRRWKRRFESVNIFEDRSAYLDVNTDDALLHSIDPSLAHRAERSHERYRMSHVETHYDQLDMPALWTFVSDEQHVEVWAELIAERFSIGPI